MTKDTRKPKTRKMLGQLDKIQDSDDQVQEECKLMSSHMKVTIARGMLDSKDLPNRFRFRENELLAIQNTVKSLLNNKKPNRYRIVMITGSPGAGKTLCTNNVLNKLQKEDFKIISINSNAIKKKRSVQAILAEALLGESFAQKEENLTSFNIITQLQKNKTNKCILYIEQIELLFSSHQFEGTQDFFDIFNHKNLKVLLIGISNTIDSLQVYADKLKIQVDEISNIVFNPYTMDQVKQILQQKIQRASKYSGIKIDYPQNLIRFTANKIDELKKGDMRVAFQFLDKLRNIVLPSHMEQIPQCINITIEIVKTALSRLGNDFSIVNNLPLNEQIILVAMYQYFVQTDELTISKQKLKQKMREICQGIGLEPKKDINQQIQTLKDYAMICLKLKTGHPVRYYLKISLPEIRKQFRNHKLFQKFV